MISALIAVLDKRFAKRNILNRSALLRKEEEKLSNTEDLFAPPCEAELRERREARFEMLKKQREEEIAAIKAKIKVCDDRGFHRWTYVKYSSSYSSMSSSAANVLFVARTPEALERLRLEREQREAERRKRELEREEQLQKEGPWYCIDCQINKYKDGAIVHPYLETFHEVSHRGF